MEVPAQPSLLWHTCGHKHTDACTVERTCRSDAESEEKYEHDEHEKEIEAEGWAGCVTSTLAAMASEAGGRKGGKEGRRERELKERK